MNIFSRVAEFRGESKPSWQPSMGPKFNFSLDGATRYGLKVANASQLEVGFYYVVNGFLNQQDCSTLTREFYQQEAHAVGVDGYQDTKNPQSIGSYRTNAWAVPLAEGISEQFHLLLRREREFGRNDGSNLPIYRDCHGEPLDIPLDYSNFELIGSTPFMRFMRYPGGGQHVPHYDAPYVASSAMYTTLMSWVLYLNTPPGSGGEFQFIDDRQWHLHPLNRDRSDWTSMAKPEDIMASVEPKCGRLLIFPHWLPHQVALYAHEGSGWRTAIRGDIAYAFE